jgi:hypothetical protein
MPVFEIPMQRRGARSRGSDVGRTVVSVEANSLTSAIRRAEVEYPRWSADQDQLLDRGPLMDGEPTGDRGMWS